MAITLDLQASEYGVPFKGAYLRIVTANVQRTRNPEQRHQVMIDVAGYATKPPNDDTRDIGFWRLYAPLSDIEAQQADDFLGKCYLWLMAQPEFANPNPV